MKTTRNPWLNQRIGSGNMNEKLGYSTPRYF